MATFDDLPELMSVPEVAEYLGIGEETVRRMLREGRLTGVFLGRAWKVSKDELRAFLERQKGAGRRRSGGGSSGASSSGSGPVDLAGGRTWPGSSSATDDDQDQGGDAAAAFASWRRVAPAGDPGYRLIG